LLLCTILSAIIDAVLGRDRQSIEADERLIFPSDLIDRLVMEVDE
jgi:hypothetical protein